MVEAEATVKMYFNKSWNNLEDRYLPKEIESKLRDPESIL
jgi:hypothetical protein